MCRGTSEMKRLIKTVPLQIEVPHRMMQVTKPQLDTEIKLFIRINDYYPKTELY